MEPLSAYSTPFLHFQVQWSARWLAGTHTQITQDDGVRLRRGLGRLLGA